MTILGVTGGIGSGKSEICRIFRFLGAPVYPADSKAKDLIGKNPELISEIRRIFGPDSYYNGSYNTKYMASIVFSDENKLKMLNNLVHPKVNEDFSLWAKMQEYKYVVFESAILFESGMNQQMHSILMIDAPENIRIARVMRRDNISESEVKNRLRSQWPAEKIIPLADKIIVNDDNNLVLPEVLKIHDTLTEVNKP